MAREDWLERQLTKIAEEARNWPEWKKQEVKRLIAYQDAQRRGSSVQSNLQSAACGSNLEQAER
jgi:hypothetical protein